MAVSTTGRTPAEAGEPLLECDLVLKGGVTSGVVYPAAIATLATRYRLRSIGGTSAGAIAAAMAAAAEYGRAGGAFDRLEALPRALAETDAAGATRLFRLLQPDRRTRATFEFLVAGLMPDARHTRRAALRWLGAGIVKFPLAALVAALITTAIVFALAADAKPATLALAVPLGAVAFVLMLALWILVVATRRIAANGYGLCSGMGNADALMPWLERTLQDLALRATDAPLTFGDLWNAGAASAHAGDPLRETELRRIDLRLMTTALSHGRPYSFPLEINDYGFDAGEWRALFPATIVEHLIAKGGAPVPDGPLAGKHRLPAMADLPILVPVRMSLAFPLLISAVPLYRIRHDPDREHDGEWLSVAEKVWFCDGGICSNFPVHFFDATLPSRPTFGIDLTDDRFVPAKPRDPEDYVWMPDRNGSGAASEVVDVERGGRPGVLGFLRAIVVTMQNWSDSTQLGAPGFRDRVVHVRLTRDEGGLNLRMQRELILRVAERGREAARRLLAHYAHRDPPPDTVTGWRNHRWVRYRVAMRLIEQSLAGIAAAERETASTPAGILAMHAKPPSYRFRSAAQRRAARAAYLELLDLARRYAAARTKLGHAIFERNAKDGPHPRPELRIRPRL
ncbi:MAG TPA: patatin-like phospholipase family protein [Rhodanobacteraceae bacterium]|nr:patatin-like phospholipase family protein [Rhodanobacteraceae bacterium]